MAASPTLCANAVQALVRYFCCLFKAVNYISMQSDSSTEVLW